MRTSLRRRTLGAAAAGLLVTGACSAHPRVPAWEPERFAGTAESVAGDPSLQGSEQALVESGIAHALPQSPLYDPAVARERFQRLLELNPRGRYAPLAGYLLPLVAEADRLAVDLDARRAREGRLRAELADLVSRAERSVAALSASEARIAEFTEEIRRLETALRARDERVRELEAQLQKLMDIDVARGGRLLRPPPP